MAKVTKKTTVPPTNKILKMIQRRRSMTAAANFQSFLLSLSQSPSWKSPASLLSLFLLSAGDGVLVSGETVMRRRGASFLRMNHFIWLHKYRIWKVKKVKTSICIARLMYTTPLTRTCVTETAPPGRYLGHRTACKHRPAQWPNNRSQAAPASGRSPPS